MAVNVPIEHTVASSSESHSSGATLITDDRPLAHTGVLAGTILAFLRRGYNVFHYITHPAPQSISPESIDVESRSTNDQQSINPVQQPQATPGPPPRSHDTSSVSEIIHANTNAGQPAAVVTTEDVSEEAPPGGRPGRSWTRVVALIFVVLLTIMLPGLIVGVVTGQVAWSLAISGAVAPAAVFFGGLWYHHNK